MLGGDRGDDKIVKNEKKVLKVTFHKHKTEVLLHFILTVTIILL